VDPLSRKVMKVEDWWIFCVRKVMEKKTGGSSMKESREVGDFLNFCLRKSGGGGG
jgi:hypothetical protein